MTISNQVNPMLFPTENSRFFINGSVGKVELATTAANSSDQKRVIVICHPHPLFQGAMDNKVVTTLMRTFSELGFFTVRFNFRGVGASEGNFDHGIGETNDLMTILNWVEQCLPEYELWLAGFSFGSYVAYRAATISEYKDKIKQLICVAPPVNYPEFAELPAPTMPFLVVQGEADEVIDPELVFSWVKTFEKAPELIRMPNTSHFFHGKLIELKQLLQGVFHD